MATNRQRRCGKPPSPKHLKLVGGWSEEFNINPLNTTLQHQWNDLGTLTLNGLFHHDFMGSSPNLFSLISSLSLDFAVVYINFVPLAATRLNHLHIFGNNSCDMFIYGVDNRPHFAQVLEVLNIETNNGCDFSWMYGLQDFRDSLRKCTNLWEFRFAGCQCPSSLDIVTTYIPCCTFRHGPSRN